jgi:hypothetical protein
LEALGPYFVITQDLLDEDGIGFIVWIKFWFIYYFHSFIRGS